MLPFDAALKNLPLGGRVMQDASRGKLIAFPHKHDIVRVCRNLGYNVPAPIISHYGWNGDQPFQTQKVTAAMLTMNPRAYVLSEMGTGKTRAALHAANYLLREGDVRRVLVVAPLSTLSQVWDREIFEHFDHLSVGVLHGSKEERLAVLNTDHQIYVINHHGVKTIGAELVARRDIDIVIVDELATFRNKSTELWKALAAVVKDRKYVWGMTGSPTPNEPVDAWAQIKLLTPNRVSAWMKEFRRQTMTQITQFKWIPKPDANDIVFEAMQPAVRFKRDDCVELPELVIPPPFKVPLSKEQERVYKEMVDKCRIAFQQGEVTAANEGVLFSKLLQITAGWVYTTKQGIVPLNNKPRLDKLEEIIDQADGKVIVFAEFVHAAEAIHAHLVSKYSASSMFPDEVALVSGKVGKRERDKIFGDFQHTPNPKILVAHPKCMAHGLTLTAANIIVWFTPTTSLEIYEQACARISRPGQTKKQLILHLAGSPIESKLYRRLQQKASCQGALLEMFEEPGDTV